MMAGIDFMKHEISETKELSIIDSDKVMRENENRIMKRDGSKVFPIPVPLRKKLELLRDESIGDMRTRFRYIKTEKYERYVEINKDRVKAIKSEVAKKSKSLTIKAHQIMIQKRRRDSAYASLMHLKAKSFYEEVDAITKKYPELIQRYEAHEFPLKNYAQKLNYDGDNEKSEWEIKRQEQEDKKAFSLTIDEKGFIDKVLKKEFDKKYGKAFQTAEERINALGRQFNESLLFGDMEVIKQVYYNLKKAEEFLTQLQEIKLE